MVKHKTMKKEILTLGCLATTAKAETETYTIGNFMQSLIDVLGFNLIDSSSALPEIVTLIFLGVLIGLVWKAVKS